MTSVHVNNIEYVTNNVIWLNFTYLFDPSPLKFPPISRKLKICLNFWIAEWFFPKRHIISTINYYFQKFWHYRMCWHELQIKILLTLWILQVGPIQAISRKRLSNVRVKIKNKQIFEIWGWDTSSLMDDKTQLKWISEVISNENGCHFVWVLPDKCALRNEEFWTVCKGNV